MRRAEGFKTGKENEGMKRVMRLDVRQRGAVGGGGGRGVRQVGGWKGLNSGQPLINTG